MAKKLIKQCFVISPIGRKYSKIHKQSNSVLKKIIIPVAQKCGYEVIRADAISMPGIITNQIIQHLIEDPLVIADLTNHNPNVFYELAFRHILKKPVVQIIKKNQKIPFDVSAIRTIFYDDDNREKISQTKQELIKQITAVEHDPTQVDAPFTPTVFPDTKIHTTEKQINNYMLKLMSTGSSLDIVSNRLHWVKGKIKSTIISRAKNNIEFNIYLPKQNPVSKELKKQNVKIYICKDLGKYPHARFTLIDKCIPGISKLAVGTGKPPRFIISEFNENSNVQVVAMARDYVNTLRRI